MKLFECSEMAGSLNNAHDERLRKSKANFLNAFMAFVDLPQFSWIVDNQVNFAALPTHGGMEYPLACVLEKQSVGFSVKLDRQIVFD